MIVEKTRDANLIRFVASSCYEQIKRDEDPEFKDFHPSFKGREYIAGFVNGKCIGIVIYCNDNDIVHVHIIVRPEYRGRYAWRLAKEALKDRKGTIYTEIPDLYPNVIRFALKLGFNIVDRSKTCQIGQKEYVVNTLRLDKCLQ